MNNKFDNGVLKYKHFSSFVKAALCIFHGSADVNCEFCSTAEVLSEKKTKYADMKKISRNGDDCRAALNQ